LKVVKILLTSIDVRAFSFYQDSAQKMLKKKTTLHSERFKRERRIKTMLTVPMLHSEDISLINTK